MPPQVTKQKPIWLQPFFWFFFQQERWRAYLQVSIGIMPGSSLLQLHKNQWQRRPLLRLLLLNLAITPALLAMLIFTAMRLFDDNVEIPYLAVALSVFLGVMLTLYVSLESGMVTASVFSMVLAPIAANPQILSFDFLVGSYFGWIVGLLATAACGTVIQVQADNGRFAASRQAGGMIIGLILSLCVFGVAVQTTSQLVYHWQAGHLTSVSTSLVIGLVPCLIFMLAATIRAKSWQRGVIAGIGGGIILALMTVYFLQGAAFDTNIVGVPLRNLILVILTAMLAILYLLPFVLANWLGGVWAGALGAGFAILAYHLAFAQFFTLYNWQHNLFLSAALVIVGLTLPRWRPILFYPLQLVWNTLLLRLEEERPSTSQPLLNWHAVYWDSGQYLPFTELPDYLLLLQRHHPATVQEALGYISQTPQRWASQQVQLALDIQQLAQVQTLAELTVVHQDITPYSLGNASTTLMPTFRRISQDAAAAMAQHSRYNQRLGLRDVASQIQAIMREITRSDQPYAYQFRPIAQQWLMLVEEAIQKMETLVIQLQEIDDPYVIGVPLTAQQQTFVGRHAITQQIETLLLDQRRPPLLLYGQRRMGKTSLLNNLGRLLPQRLTPLFVDLQGPVSFANNHAGLLFNIARHMQRSAKEQRQIDLPPISRKSLEADPATAFDEWLTTVEDNLTADNGYIVLMLDEFEVLDYALLHQKYEEAFVLGMLRHIIQHRHKIKVLLSGSHTLNEFKQWSSYLINAEVLHLSNLTKDEAFQLIECPIQEFSLAYEPAAATAVFQLTSGHPYLLQLMCSEIIAQKNSQPLPQRYIVTKPDVQRVIPFVLQRGTLFFADIERNQISEAGKHLLQALAKRPLAFNPNNHRMETLLTLQQRELIRPSGASFDFAIELIRLWFLHQ